MHWTAGSHRQADKTPAVWQVALQVRMCFPRSVLRMRTCARTGTDTHTAVFFAALGVETAQMSYWTTLLASMADPQDGEPGRHQFGSMRTSSSRWSVRTWSAALNTGHFLSYGNSVAKTKHWENELETNEKGCLQGALTLTFEPGQYFTYLNN